MSPSRPSSLCTILSLGTTVGWVAVATFWFAIAGSATTILFSIIYADVRALMPPAAISAAVLGGFFWWVLIERGVVSYLRGFTVGGLMGLFAIPGMWFVFGILFIGPGMPSLSDVGPSIGAAYLFGFFGFLLAGWLTLTLGCLSAVLLTAIRIRFPR